LAYDRPMGPKRREPAADNSAPPYSPVIVEAETEMYLRWGADGNML
jgi:hypothetical protein